MEKQDKPLVSIICTVYNHESFITQCLDGFIAQRTNFPFEIIVHDDASTDNTKAIIKNYEMKYPDLFNNIYQTENQFIKKDVNIWADIMFPKAKGKYIALCEGDDYWTDPNKLQKQVDFLEANVNASLVFSNCHVDVKGVLKTSNLKYPNYFTFREYLNQYNAIPTCTMVFRKDNLLFDDRTINLLRGSPVGDFPLRFILGEIGDFIFLSDSMAVYRKHDNGVSTFFHNSNHYLGILKMYQNLNIYFNYKYDYFLGLHLQNIYERLFYAFCKEKSTFAACRVFLKACLNPNGGFLGLTQVLNILKHGIKEFLLLRGN
jgi:glycosyltransferase involved in cell wall biosynthesis